jgi:hypothetical protein
VILLNHAPSDHGWKHKTFALTHQGDIALEAVLRCAVCRRRDSRGSGIWAATAPHAEHGICTSCAPTVCDSILRNVFGGPDYTPCPEFAEVATNIIIAASILITCTPGADLPPPPVRPCSACPSTLQSLRELLEEIDREVYERRTSGNDENWQVLDEKADRARALIVQSEARS